jgi:ACS family hexuronate transporter-like MFS transporter
MRRPKFKLLMLGFAFLATVINYLDRQTLSVMAPLLTDRFHISSKGYSRIIFAFMLAYTLMNGVWGWMIDRLGSKIGYGLSIALWSGAEILHAFSTGARSLSIFRFLLGIGEAGNYPAGVKLIAEWFPSEERSTACGIFNSGASIGAILAPPLLAWIVLTAGWRAAFVTIGLLGFAWLAAWMILFRGSEPVGKDVDAPRVPFGDIIRSRFVWQLTVSKVFSDPVWYFYTFWLPQYLKVVQHFSLQQIGSVAWIPFLSAALGNLAGGVVFSGLLRSIESTAIARRIAVVLFYALMIPAVLVGAGLGPAASIGLISIATFGYAGSLANLLAIPADAFPKNTIASIWGLASLGSGVGGMFFSLMTGWLVDRYSFRPAFVLFGLLPVLAAWIVWTLPKASSAEALTQFS